MKTKRYLKKICFTLLAGGLLSGATTSCTDLDEKVFSEIDSSNYFTSAASVDGAVASIYYAAIRGFLEYFYQLNEFSADQIAWRTWNGGQWGYDNAEKFVLSTQTWTANSVIIQNAWNNAWTTIGLCNSLLSELQKIDPSELGMTAEMMNAYYAEIRTMRAWAYYNNFELWGGALPIFTSGDTTDVPGSVSSDFNEGCRLIWQFISDELDATWSALAKEDGTSATRTRLNQGMNRMLKMRLLLNSELWTGVDRYSDCANLAEQIIRGDYGTYSLATDYRNIYEPNNYTCPEVVFAFAMNINHNYNPNDFMATNNRDTPFLPYNYTDIFGGTWNQPGWNCVIVAPSHDNTGTISANNDYSTGSKSFVFDYGDKLGAVYDRMNDNDIRKAPFHSDAAGNWSGNFLMGAQYSWFDNSVIPADAELEGVPLYYTDQVGDFAGNGHVLEPVMSPRWGMTNSGYRYVLYPILPEESGLDFRNAGQVEFRLAEAYYTLAECKMRMGGGTSPDAVSLINQVRQRYYNGNTNALQSPGPVFDSFNMDWLLSEWGLEYLDEGRRRRTDLRRFDKFTQGQWWFFGRATDPERPMPEKRDRKYEWFPMPQSAMMVNPGLIQVPGY
ncbi:MAG: RagB/SusD family nutrient uptake outer membrane protein [Muribaculaceae bacterium]|nr:RagB/SusD family nutrient uptake outer membrane protein [Muribaculaceae bacterium]